MNFRSDHDRIFFEIEIFNHFPDHTQLYTILIKVPKKFEFPGLSTCTSGVRNFPPSTNISVRYEFFGKVLIFW